MPLEVSTCKRAATSSKTTSSPRMEDLGSGYFHSATTPLQATRLAPTSAAHLTSEIRPVPVLSSRQEAATTRSAGLLKGMATLLLSTRLAWWLVRAPLRAIRYWE